MSRLLWVCALVAVTESLTAVVRRDYPVAGLAMLAAVSLLVVPVRQTWQ